MIKQSSFFSAPVFEVHTYILNASNEESLLLPEGHLLLRAEFQRVENNLIVRGTGENAGHSVLVKNYFSQTPSPELQTMEGARLSPELVSLLAGPSHPGLVAEAGGSGEVSGSVGAIDSVNGEVVVVRAGLKIGAEAGMALHEGDVIVTDAGGGVGMVYADGTTVSLGGDGRLVIEEVSYDPAAGVGKSSTNVVQGVFSFVSGGIAKLGDEAMVFKTPVATIGVRGTTVAGQAGAEGSDNSFTLLADADGGVGEISVSNAAGTQILTAINQTTTVSSFTVAPTAAFIMSPAQVTQRYGQAVSIRPKPPVAKEDNLGDSDSEEEKAVTEEEAQEEKIDENVDEAEKSSSGEEMIDGEGQEKEGQEKEGQEKEGENSELKDSDLSQEKMAMEEADVEDGPRSNEFDVALKQKNEEDAEFQGDSEQKFMDEELLSTKNASTDELLNFDGRELETIDGTTEESGPNSLGPQGELYSGDGGAENDSSWSFAATNFSTGFASGEVASVYGFNAGFDLSNNLTTTKNELNEYIDGIYSDSIESFSKIYESGLQQNTVAEAGDSTTAASVSNQNTTKSANGELVEGETVNGSGAGEGGVVVEGASGSSAGDASGSPQLVATTATYSGKAIDGYISGATVFADANENGIYDSGESTTTTDADGNFTLVDALGSLIMSGGTDISTGQAFQGRLLAPAGSKIVSPLTTLVKTMIDSGHASDISSAELAVQQALGISQDIDLSIYDPIQATIDGDANAGAVISAGVLVQNTIVQAAAVLRGAAANIDASTANQAVFAAMAKSFAGQSGSVDMTDSTVISNMISVAASDELGLTGSALTTVNAAKVSAASIITTSNSAINSFNGYTGSNLLSHLSNVALISQGVAATNIMQATDPNDTSVTFAGGVLSNFTTNFEGQVLAAGADRDSNFMSGGAFVHDFASTFSGSLDLIPGSYGTIGDFTVTESSALNIGKGSGLIVGEEPGAELAIFGVATIAGIVAETGGNMFIDGGRLDLLDGGIVTNMADEIFISGLAKITNSGIFAGKDLIKVGDSVRLANSQHFTAGYDYYSASYDNGIRLQGDAAIDNFALMATADSNLNLYDNAALKNFGHLNIIDESMVLNNNSTLDNQNNLRVANGVSLNDESIMTNSGLLDISTGSITLEESSNFINQGNTVVHYMVDLSGYSTLTNSGDMTITDELSVYTDGHFVNSGSVRVLEDDLSLYNSAKLENHGNILTVGEGVLLGDLAQLSNSAGGSILSSEFLTVGLGTAVSNEGTFTVVTDGVSIAGEYDNLQGADFTVVFYDLEVTGTLFNACTITVVEDDLVILSGGTLNNTGTITVGGAVNTIGTLVNDGNITATSFIGAGSVSGSGSLLTDGSLDVYGDIATTVTGSVSATGDQTVAGDMTNAGSVYGLGDLTISGMLNNSGLILLDIQGQGVVDRPTDSVLSVAGDFINDGKVFVGGTVSHTNSYADANILISGVGSSLTNNGIIGTADDLWIVDGDLINNGTINVANYIYVYDNLSNNDGGLITVDDEFRVANGNLDNYGVITTTDRIFIDSADAVVTNHAGASISTSEDLDVNGALSNSGILSIGDDLFVGTSGSTQDLTNESGGYISAPGYPFNRSSFNLRG